MYAREHDDNDDDKAQATLAAADIPAAWLIHALYLITVFICHAPECPSSHTVNYSMTCFCLN